MIGKIRILHISDIHYSKKDLTNFNELVQKPLFESLKENTKEELIDLICISGDLINQGTGGFDSTEEAFYEFKKCFLHPLAELLSIKAENIIICPGNHDVNRELDKDTEEKIQEELKNGKEIEEIITNSRNVDEYDGLKRVFPYKKFEEDFYKESENSNISLFETYHYRNINNINIGILSLNSVWRCFSDDSKILLGKPQILNHKAKLLQNNINILISHYPLENCSDIDTPISELIKLFKLCCYGHKHSMDSLFEQTVFGDKVVKNSAKGLMPYNVQEKRIDFVNGYTIIDFTISEQLEHCDIQHFIYSFGSNTFGPNIIETGKSLPIRFYFSENSTVNDNFDRNRYLENIKAQAGKRYTPELNVDVPVYKILNSFSNKLDINKTLKEKNNKLQDYYNNPPFNKPFDFGEEDKELKKTDFEIQRINEILISINSNVENLIKTNDKIYINELYHFTNDLLEICTVRSKIELTILRKKYGTRLTDFRIVDSNDTETLSHFTALRTLLEKFISFIKSKEVEAFYSKFLYITGPGGIGKTHCLVDYCCKNSSIFVFFGEDFTISEPWVVMKEKLGLPSTCTKSQLFDFFSNTARKNNEIGIICIDAVNESEKIGTWNKWIPVIYSDLSSYENLKICISCRDTYINEISDTLNNWVEYIHNGFLGKEYLAVDRFCEYYKILPPSFPYISPDVYNPLLLQMICENLLLEGTNTFPKEQNGIKGVFEKYTHNINKKISKKCDLDCDDELVQKFVFEIAKAMLINKSKLLTYDEYKTISNTILSTTKYSDSLAKQCENESLFTKISKDNKKYIRFTYERYCDFYIAKVIISNGIQNYIQNDKFIITESSVLEILATLLPEEIENKEIVDYDDSEYSKRAFLLSIPIRSPESVTDRTKQYILKYFLGKNDSISILLSIATTPNNPLNILFFSELLKQISLCERDSLFSRKVIENYENEDSVKILIDTSYSKDLSIYSHESKLLWLLTLTQFCSIPDRRIRDQASKAMTVLLVNDISLCVELIEILNKYDDEYIIERIVASIYASFLITKEIKILKKVSEYILENKLLSLYSNILIQEHLDLILDLALRNKVISDPIASTGIERNSERFCVPDINEYNEITKDEIFKNSNINFVDQWYTDFQRYILFYRIQDFDLEKSNIEIKDIYRWFVVELYRIGYPGKNKIAWEFDAYNINIYGAGRGKRIYPERLSKKYYWIFLHRLIGLLKNTCPLKENTYSYKEYNNTILFSLKERDIDLSDIRFALNDEYPQLQINSSKIVLAENPKQWIGTEADFIDEKTILNGFQDTMNHFWIPLNYAQNSKIELKDSGNGYQESCILISASLISKNDLASLNISEIRDLTNGNVFQNISQDYTLYLGEYPFSKSYAYLLGTDERNEFEYRNDDIKIYPSTYEMLRGREWEYDCSFKSEDCLFPSKFLINILNLQWDSNCGWYIKEQNNLAFFSTIINGSTVAFLRKDLLSEIDDNFCLLFRVYHEKIYSPSMFNPGGLHSIRSIYTMDKNDLVSLIKFDDYNWFKEE